MFFFLLVRIVLIFCLSADRYSSAGAATAGSFSSGQLLQYESSSHYVDGKCKYEEYHESYVKIDGHKASTDEFKEQKGFSLLSNQGYELACLGKTKADEIRRTKFVESAYAGSFKGLKDDKRDSLDGTLRSAGLPRLVPSVSFNDHLIHQSASKRKLSVVRLSFKRTSCDGEEISEICKSSC